MVDRDVRDPRRRAGGRARGAAAPVADPPRSRARALHRRRRDREHVGRGTRTAVSPTLEPDSRAAYALGVVAAARARDSRSSWRSRSAPRSSSRRLSTPCSPAGRHASSRSVPPVLVRGIAAPLVVTAGGTEQLAHVRVRQPAVPDLSIDPPEADGRLEAHVTARRRGRHRLPPVAARRRRAARARELAVHGRTATPRSSCIPTSPPRAASSTALRRGRFRDPGLARPRSARARHRVRRRFATTNPTTTSVR